MAIEYRLENVPGHNLELLRITGDLDFESRPEFQKAVKTLLLSKQPKLAIDLSTITRMSSMYLGTLVDVAAQATAAGKTFSVILLPRMASVCRDAGLDKMMTIVDVS